MVSEKKKQAVQEVKAEFKKYPVIGILSMFKLPARQLHQIRNKLREKATIKMVKKRLIIRALKEAGLKDLEKLIEYVHGEAALLLTNEDPFRLARVIEKSKSKAPAKPGDIAPMDIEIKAGPTDLAAGPVIGELQKAKIPASVQDGKIAVMKDTVIAKEGDEIPPEVAGIMAKLGIEPMEIGLNLLAVWENGQIFTKDILFVPLEKYIEDIQLAHSSAFNLALNIGWVTPDNIPLLLSKAHQEALSLAREADILTSETVGTVLAKAQAQPEALKSKLKPVEAPKEEPKPEEKKEEKPAEEKKEEPKEEAPKKEETPKEKKKQAPKEEKEKKPTKEKEESS